MFAKGRKELYAFWCSFGALIVVALVPLLGLRNRIDVLLGMTGMFLGVRARKGQQATQRVAMAAIAIGGVVLIHAAAKLLFF